MSSRGLPRANAPVAVLLLTCATAGAQPVSREIPPAFKAHMAPWLTPSKEALKLRARGNAGDEGAVLLLREVLRRVEDDGRVLLAVHQIHEARTADGAEALGRAVVPFLKSHQRIHLALARSIQPDGTEQEVLGEAAFLQSPQRQAESAIYTDAGELVLVFPRVKPKTVTESIILIEDREALVPSEFSAVLSADSRWPARRIRHAVDLSSRMAERLRTAALGGAPGPRREKAARGRARLSWEWAGLAASPPEPSQAPSDQAGPAVWLSTLRDWEAFGRWYEQLLKGRGELPPALAAQVDQWTRRLGSPDEVLAALFEKVAREVRYTGLEFGIAAVRPHEPGEVWANRYGDCKDKANLLVAMLRHKGISARLALLNTEHAGRIEPSTPAPQQFNHAIVAVPRAEGGWTFCDPTIAHGRPGLLSPSGADRDALLVRAGEPAQFVRTPPREAGAIEYAFDLSLGLDGGLSGWMTVEPKEFYGAWFAEVYVDQSQAFQRERLQELASHFFRGAQLIDFEPVVAQSAGAALRLRAYFVVPGTNGDSEKKQSLAFPPTVSVRPDFGDRSARRTSYFQWQGTRVIKARFKLPPGMAAPALPRPFAVDMPAASVEARWEGEPGALTARFWYRARMSAVSPENFSLLHSSLRSLDVWLQKPVEIAAGAAAAASSAAPAPAGLDPADFPLMPSGEGQCELAEERFPLDSKPELRREAFQKVLQWFPNDKTASFRARMRLAEIDLEADPKDAKALASAKRLVAAGRGEVAAAALSWGEFMLGSWLADAGEREEALSILTRLAFDESLSEFRRAWSAVRSAALQLDQAPAEAESTLRRTLDLLPESAPAHHRLLAEALLRQGKAEPLSELLAQVASARGENAPPIFDELANLSRELLQEGRREHARDLAQRLDKAAHEKPALAPAAAKAKAVLEQADAVGAYQEIATALQRQIEVRPPAWWGGAKLPEQAETQAQLRKALAERAGSWKPEARLRGLLELLTRFAPDPDRFPRDLWTALHALDERPADEPLFQVVDDLCSKLPQGEIHRYECAITSAKRRARQGAVTDALEACRRLRQDSKAPWSMRQAALCLSGEIHEQQNDFRSALASYSELAAEPELAPRSLDSLLRAAFIALEIGKRDRAIELIKRLGRVKDEELRGAQSPDQIRRLLALVDTGKAEGFWARQEKWWPAWRRLEARVGLEPLKDDIEVPIVSDVYALGGRFGQALQANDRQGGFATLRTLAHAARWEPAFVAEFAGVASMGASLAPERVVDLRLLAVEMLTDLDGGDARTTRQGQVLLVANLADSGRAAQACDLAAAYLAKNSSQDELDQAMVRVWAYAAMGDKRPLEPVAAALAQQIERPADSAGLGIAVVTLAKVLAQLGRADEELQLLKREEARPEIRANPEISRTIQDRLRALTNDKERSARFTQAIARWRSAHQPPWFDYVSPKALDAAAEERLDETLKRAPEGMLAAERVKLGLLVAESSGQPYPRKVQALEMAMKALEELAQRHSEVVELYRSFYDDPSFEEELRARWLWMSLAAFAAADRDVGALAAHPLAAGFTELQRRFIASCKEYAAVDRRSAPALAAYGEKLLAGGLDPWNLESLFKIIRELAKLGAFDAAQKLVDRLGSAEVRNALQRDPAPLQLDLSTSLRRQRRIEPMLRRMREVLLEVAPKDRTAPAELADLRHPEQLAYEEPRLAQRIRWTLLANGELIDSTSIGKLARDLDPTGKVGLAAVAAAARAATDDSDRATLVWLAVGVIDIDDPAQRREMLSVLEPYRNPDGNSETRAEIQKVDLWLALRGGDREGLAHLASGLESSGDAEAKSFAAFARVVRALADGDAQSLRRILERLPAEALLDPRQMPWMIRSLALSGMSEQAQIVRGKAREEVYRCVVRSWAGPTWWDVDRAMELANALGQPELLPARWLADLQRTLRESQLRRRVAHFAARNGKDWKRAAAIANELIKEEPTFYSFYWLRAEALVKLGRKREAIPALETFVRYCHDNIMHPEAVKLLKELR